MNLLYQPMQLGSITLSNRIVMSPMTRNRAATGNVADDLTVEYYAQRASAGLIITEAVQISSNAQGYSDTPGLHTPEQVAAWRKVTDAVHHKGGHIFAQIWHTGRMSHVQFQPNGAAPMAPSAIAAKAKTFIVGTGFVPTSTPREMTVKEISAVVNDFRTAAANAIAAGFDGVEIHGGHGYLLDSFLREGANHRTDHYGGSIQNKARFMLEATQAVCAEIGAQRTGIRISPVSPVNDSVESNPQPLFEYLVAELAKLNPVFIDVVEGWTGGLRDNAPFDYVALRSLYKGVWMLNNGYTKETAEAAVTQGLADLIAIGRPFITNPDLVRRYQEGAQLNEPYKDAPLYGGVGAHGYTDYPALA